VLNLTSKACLIFPLIFLFLTDAAAEDVGAVRDIRQFEVDERQLRQAVASRTLTWLTGSSSNNDYISVGRMANYFGFVGLRVASGQSLTRNDVANDTLAVLDDAQRESLIALLLNQKTRFEETQLARFQMNRTLEGMLVGEETSRESFLELGRHYGRSEALLGQVIAQALGAIAQTLSIEQKDRLSQIRAAHISGQGHLIDRQKLKFKLERKQKQELVNIAARFLSWTTGNQEFNDFEVVGKPSQHFGFVSLRMESNHGVKRGEVANEVLGILTAQQILLIDAAVSSNVQEFGVFLEARSKLMRTFEVALKGDQIDDEQVRLYGAAVGESEASMTWAQARAMLEVRSSMSEQQTVDLLTMRNKYVVAKDSGMPQEPVERGRQLFAQCVLCHDSVNPNSAGPSLAGIVGRDIGSDKLFKRYSLALQDFARQERLWSESLLDRFLTSPRSLVPGTYMGFDGLKASDDRAAVIAYLKTRK
jgi:cytochrome c2